MICDQDKVVFDYPVNHSVEFNGRTLHFCGGECMVEWFRTLVAERDARTKKTVDEYNRQQREVVNE